MDEINKSTDELYELIETEPTEFIEKIETEKLTNYDTLFTNFFFQMLEEKGLSLAQLVNKTTISQSHIYQIAERRRRLSRDTAIVLAFAMKLDLEHTQKFLKYSNNAMLYPKVKRDAIIICCIECGMTSEQANELLQNKSEKGLVF